MKTSLIPPFKVQNYRHIQRQVKGWAKDALSISASQIIAQISPQNKYVLACTVCPRVGQSSENLWERFPMWLFQ